MRTIVLVVLCCLLSGCMSTPRLREYRYELDLRNTTDVPVAVELLRGRTSALSRLRVDLAPGGSFIDAYTVHGDAEYLEARVRPLAADTDAPWYIIEMGTGRSRVDIVRAGTGLGIVPRRPALVPGEP